MKKYDWSRLNHMQVGRYAEYLVKMEFALQGFDVYEPEVDYHGIDFVIRRESGKYYEIQVKSIRSQNTGYIFLLKSKFVPRENLFAAIVILDQGKKPRIYLIPSKKWLRPNSLLVDRTYHGKTSKPEWGLNISRRNTQLLHQYEFDRVVRHL